MRDSKRRRNNQPVAEAPRQPPAGQAVLQHTHQSWEGPLPPPRALEEFKALVPGPGADFPPMGGRVRPSPTVRKSFARRGCLEGPVGSDFRGSLLSPIACLGRLCDLDARAMGRRCHRWRNDRFGGRSVPLPASSQNRRLIATKMSPDGIAGARRPVWLDRSYGLSVRLSTVGSAVGCSSIDPGRLRSVPAPHVRWRGRAR